MHYNLHCHGKWLHSRLTLTTMSSIWLQSIGLQTPTYWISAVNSDILEQHINQSGELALMGDFNITVNKPSDPDPSTFLDTLDSFNLVNKIEEPTHQLSNILGLIIHNADSNIVPSTKVCRLFLDHHMVFLRVAYQSAAKNIQDSSIQKVH